MKHKSRLDKIQERLPKTYPPVFIRFTNDNTWMNDRQPEPGQEHVLIELEGVSPETSV